MCTFQVDSCLRQLAAMNESLTFAMIHTSVIGEEEEEEGDDDVEGAPHDGGDGQDDYGGEIDDDNSD